MIHSNYEIQKTIHLKSVSLESHLKYALQIERSHLQISGRSGERTAYQETSCYKLLSDCGMVQCETENFGSSH